MGMRGSKTLCKGTAWVGGGRDTGCEALTIAQEAPLNSLVVLVPKSCQG